MKTCSRCNKPKLDSEFHKNPETPDGLRYECKSCRKPAKLDLTRNLQNFYTTYRVNGGECADL